MSRLFFKKKKKVLVKFETFTAEINFLYKSTSIYNIASCMNHCSLFFTFPFPPPRLAGVSK